MSQTKKVILGVSVIGFSIFLGYVKGYYSGFEEGMTVGEVRELVNQGYTVEDATEIASKRRQMSITSQELFQKED